MRKFLILCVVLFLSATVTTVCFGQKKDTLFITASSLLTRNIPLGNQQYLVYFKKGKDSSRINFQYWNREVRKEMYKNREAIVVNQYWEDNADIIHRSYSVSDASDFHPLYQTSWWKNKDTIITDFEEQTAVFPDKMFRKNIDSSRKAALASFKQAGSQYILNWHLDLETFSMLPFKDKITFAIPFYDAGFSAPKFQYYTVNGSGVLNGYDGHAIDCWLLQAESPGSKESFWISKKTKEVVKLEQQNGTVYRYKIKLKL